MTYEPRHKKTDFAYAKTKTQISFAVTAKLISAFVFATRIVQSLYFLNPKFYASRHILWQYSPVYIGPGRKPRRPVFSQRGSYNVDSLNRQRVCYKSVKDFVEKEVNKTRLRLVLIILIINALPAKWSFTGCTIFRLSVFSFVRNVLVFL